MPIINVRLATIKGPVVRAERTRNDSSCGHYRSLELLIDLDVTSNPRDSGALQGPFQTDGSTEGIARSTILPFVEPDG